jgi:dihydrodipicolinate synthase/N-acetylneuraminate lyase
MPLSGVLVAAITPRRPSGHEIDLGATLEVIDYLCASGIQGIALLGSTGEFVHFDFEDRIRLAALAVRRSRVPVLINISHSTLDGSLKLARDAASAGVAGLLLMPPYYFRYDQAAVQQYFLRFAAEFGPRAPTYLYNIPFFTSEIASQTACELLDSGRFAGIKDSSGKLDYLEALKSQRAKKSFTLLIGNDVVFTLGRSAGADGVVSGVACAVPELMLALDKAIASGQIARVTRLEARLKEFIERIDRLPTPVGVREAAAIRGIKIGPHAIPFNDGSARAVEEFRSWFKAWLPDLKKDTGA